MIYKDYVASVAFDEDANVFYGEVINIRDVITFEGETVNQLRQAFHDSVDDYLDFCSERGESPEEPYSGELVVRIEPELHKRAATEAFKRGVSMDSLIGEALSDVIADPAKVKQNHF